ncbi:alcohol dehydrogenase catalytic domain-containing protein [Lacticaseibacillus thailandensis]|uniref:Oxidoreductase n=1 Tax=Lacticaseibacillus thailandensis DSM 22698 = JCM 13996 TaxID=1423810 RepID=A0A0R2C855_9LACO|nr:zinc-binding dehydrogenase [Lacticaseibacillus thailandensis]KRM87429.1 oxidoreductase [Lacticaseibacillus thailandensis DSM 22698 = JCM 13996]
MRALVVTASDQRTIEALTWTDRPVPQPGPEQVLVRTAAVGLNPVDYKVVQAGNPAWRFPHTVGVDIAGTVAAVGANVTRVRVGDRVAGHGDLAQDGTFAECAIMPAAALAVIPTNVSWVTAAGSLCAGLTAYQALYRKANLTAVDTVLVHAGAGGVGSMAIQLARAAGKQVATTVSAHKQDFVGRLHPDLMIDYRTEDVDQRLADWTHGLGVDLIINTIGQPAADLSRLAYNGQLVCVLDTPDTAPGAKALAISDLNLGGAHRSGDPRQVADLGRMAQALLALIATGQVDPQVERVVPAADIVTGLQMIAADKVVGKVVATFA